MELVADIATKLQRSCVSCGAHKNLVQAVCAELTRFIGNVDSGIQVLRLQILSGPQLPAHFSSSLVFRTDDSLEQAAVFPVALGEFDQVPSESGGKLQLHAFEAIVIDARPTSLGQMTSPQTLKNELDQISVAFANVQESQNLVPLIDALALAARDGWDEGNKIAAVGFRTLFRSTKKIEIVPLFEIDLDTFNVLWAQRYQGQYRRIHLELHGHDNPVVSPGGAL